MARRNLTRHFFKFRFIFDFFSSVTDDNGVSCSISNGLSGVVIRSLDVPLMCPITAADGVPHVFPTPLFPIRSKMTGVAYNIYNNLWDTNYILWYPYQDGDADFRARFKIDFMGG